MYYIKLLSFLLILITFQPMVAQNDWDGVLQPQLVLRNKVNGSYNQQWQLSNRFIGLDEQQDFSLQFIDIMHLSSFVIGDNQRLGLGIQYRFQDNFESESLNEFRITEQYILKNSMENGHSAHRFRIEQRIFPKTTLHRFRYRFSRDLPLQGQDINIKETYIVGHLETVFTAADNRAPRYDQRITLGLGWLFGLKTVWLNSLEYRLANFTQKSRHRVFLISSLNISL